MSGHTPGPWQVDPRYPIDVQTADGKQEVCTPFYKGCEGRNIRPVTDVAPKQEALANARLIAAAPELLAMLLALECDINTMVYCYDKRSENFWRAMAVAKENAILARAAIAKANGEA